MDDEFLAKIRALKDVEPSTIMRPSYKIKQRVKNDLVTFTFHVESELFKKAHESYNSVMGIIKNIVQIIREYDTIELEIGHSTDEQFEYQHNMPRKFIGFQTISKIEYKMIVDEDIRNDSNFSPSDKGKLMAKAVDLQDRFINIKSGNSKILLKSINYTLSEKRKHTFEYTTTAEAIDQIKRKTDMMVNKTYPLDQFKNRGYKILSQNVSTRYEGSPPPYYPSKYSYESARSYRNPRKNQGDRMDQIVNINAQGFSTVVTDISMKISVHYN